MDKVDVAVEEFNNDCIKRIQDASSVEDVADFYLLGRVFEGHHKRGIMLDWGAFNSAVDAKFGPGSADRIKSGLQDRLDRYGFSMTERPMEEFLREVILKMKKERLI